MKLLLEGRLELTYDPPERAKLIIEALSVDDPTYVNARLDGNRVIVDVKGNSASSLRETLDDYLACVQVAEKAGDVSARHQGED